MISIIKLSENVLISSFYSLEGTDMNGKTNKSYYLYPFAKKIYLLETLQPVPTLLLEDEQLVIVAAPSNTAIDIIVKNLVKFIPRREILRLVSVANSTKIDQDIELVSTVEANDVIERFEDGELKVLCGTLQILGKIPEARVKATHIIIDEAGQANEGEIFNGDQ